MVENGIKIGKHSLVTLQSQKDQGQVLSVGGTQALKNSQTEPVLSIFLL